MDLALDDLIKKKSSTDKPKGKGPLQKLQGAGKGRRVPQNGQAVVSGKQGLDTSLDSIIARKTSKPFSGSRGSDSATRKRLGKAVQKQGKRGKVKGVLTPGKFSKNKLAKKQQLAKGEGVKKSKRDIIDAQLNRNMKKRQRVNQLAVGKPLKQIYHLSVNARKGKGKFAGLLTQAMLKKMSGQRLRATTPLPARSSALLGDSGLARRLISLPSYQSQTSSSRKNLVLAELQRQRLQPYLEREMQHVDRPTITNSPLSGSSGGRMAAVHHQRMVMGGVIPDDVRPSLSLNDSERALASKIKVMAQLDKIPLPGNVQRRFMEGSFAAHQHDMASLSSRGMRGYDTNAGGGGYDRMLH